MLLLIQVTHKLQLVFLERVCEEFWSGGNPDQPIALYYLVNDFIIQSIISKSQFRREVASIFGDEQIMVRIFLKGSINVYLWYHITLSCCLELMGLLSIRQVLLK